MFLINPFYDLNNKISHLLKSKNWLKRSFMPTEGCCTFEKTQLNKIKLKKAIFKIQVWKESFNVILKELYKNCCLGYLIPNHKDLN